MEEIRIEYGCNSTYTHKKGFKDNSLKPPVDVLINKQFPKAIWALSLATLYGHEKYKEFDQDFLNFKNVKGGSQTYFDAAARHNTERSNIDLESNLPHVIHAVWNMLAGLELAIEEENIDIKNFSKKYIENLHSKK